MRALIDRGRSEADALAIAARTVKEITPPREVSRLALYHTRALKHALRTDPVERLRIGGEGV